LFAKSTAASSPVIAEFPLAMDELSAGAVVVVVDAESGDLM
jgi:hypothetical protein